MPNKIDDWDAQDALDKVNKDKEENIKVEVNVPKFRIVLPDVRKIFKKPLPAPTPAEVIETPGTIQTPPVHLAKESRIRKFFTKKLW